jgi:serpin B
VLAGESTSTAATAASVVNMLGVDLLHQASKPDANFLISPYSIQSALAMTYAGAEGITRDEMAKVLHYPQDDAELNRSFTALQKSLDDLMQESARKVEHMRKYGVTNDPVVLTVANRLFGQSGYDFRGAFLALVKDNYGAPFEPVDFKKDAPGATMQINSWVEQQTRQRIRDLIPDDALNRLTRLVLVNAIYLKAPWDDEFPAAATKSRRFHVSGGKAVDVPTMMHKRFFFYAKRDGFSVVAMRYRSWDLQFLILLPDQVDGLRELESTLTADLLAGCARLTASELILYLPKLEMEPPLLPLSRELQSLGMKSAFDRLRANFDRIAPRRPDNYLFISEVFHKTFLKLDEKGTEAAAATAVGIAKGLFTEKPKPIEVKVDHPFLFAIQHRPSGACLFLGHVADPR